MALLGALLRSALQQDSSESRERRELDNNAAAYEETSLQAEQQRRQPLKRLDRSGAFEAAARANSGELEVEAAVAPTGGQSMNLFGGGSKRVVFTPRIG